MLCYYFEVGVVTGGKAGQIAVTCRPLLVRNLGRRQSGQSSLSLQERLGKRGGKLVLIVFGFTKQATVIFTDACMLPFFCILGPIWRLQICRKEVDPLADDCEFTVFINSSIVHCIQWRSL